ncbi:MAG: class I SAM-dependent methyltransferase [Dehalococcoidales bacterium]|nr:class I SAM-dependent methyltransferase [Dehalococcoidales bacterium]
MSITRLLIRFIPSSFKVIFKDAVIDIMREHKAKLPSQDQKQVTSRSSIFANILPLNHATYGPWPRVLPLPSEELMGTVSLGKPEAFYVIGEAWAHLVSSFLPSNPILLDMGCGCGKLARFLYLNPDIQYIGFDLFLPSIQWCKSVFPSFTGERFRFFHFDGYSSVWNPSGKLSAIDYIFPLKDDEANIAVAGSLFTHLTEKECEHYLLETRRVLKPRGVFIVSIHDKPTEGEQYSGDHSRIDVKDKYFIKLATDRGFSLKQDLGYFIGQRVLVFE